MIAVSYIMKRKIKKIFFEIISNSKIFNINFFKRNGQQPRFSQTYRGGLDKGGDWTTSNTVYIILWIQFCKIKLIIKYHSNSLYEWGVELSTGR